MTLRKEIIEVLTEYNAKFSTKSNTQRLFNLLRTTILVDWVSISWRRTLSEEFIRKFYNKLYWPYISADQKLSENLIRDFSRLVDWKNISQYQKLTEDFVWEFRDRLDWWSVGEKFPDVHVKYLKELKSSTGSWTSDRVWESSPVVEELQAKDCKEVEENLKEVFTCFDGPPEEDIAEVVADLRKRVEAIEEDLSSLIGVVESLVDLVSKGE